jgi:SAM-dependent methyltransferase/uncharacterized protein YbaR (Trm112 family)
MRRRLLDIVVCSNCRGRLALDEVFAEETGTGFTPERAPCTVYCAWRGRPVGSGVNAAECGACYAADVLEGVLRCVECDERYPVIDGIPRLLRPALLARIRVRHRGFFARHPELCPTEEPVADGAVADTLESFTRQRLDLQPPGPEFVQQWREHLATNLGRACTLTGLAGRLVLDVGCGFGRHLRVATDAGAETVGVDLSGGVDVARRNVGAHPRCHIVQADIHDRPLRERLFDVVWSFGVLHHLADPRAGFRTIVPFARPDGGLVAIWVYGYRGMTFSYRLSHMRPLHRVVRRLSAANRVRASKAVAGILALGWWGPLRLARRLGLGRLATRAPLAVYVDHPWTAQVAAVHDRLSTPITHFHDRDELHDWLASARLADAVVEDTDRRGWRAYGWRQRATAGRAVRTTRREPAGGALGSEILGVAARAGVR